MPGFVDAVAAALLVGGAVTGQWLAALAGWALAWTSRRLSRPEVQGTVLVVPGLVAGGALLWLWGRTEGRWASPSPPAGWARR
ncbi:hypothetical protein GQS52_10335 [Streptomyces sp. SCUT-3]|uniref:hypothetical protein n=1 Tax=Streptomyces sp. SCUT-3 TaxID=2684469 RepID=UPI0015FD9932|nr:hypothetical protein [Streptomyces sp. SCUT-3]QMV22116.1 hypothetical protein GQS52_10335 [Streptomyces sp. SCUT-3]